jgi:cytochrome c-type biogenesis protein CcmH
MNSRKNVRIEVDRAAVRAGLRGLMMLVLVSMIAGSAQARDWGYDLGDELMSPFCPGRTLASCPSPQAAELVQWIVTQEAAGSTKDEVLEILVERYGEEILGAPPAKGINLLAYIFPILGFLVGGGVAFIVLRRIVGQSRSENGANLADRAGGVAPAAASAHPAPAPAPDVTDDELARIVDAELAGRA